MCLIVLHDSRIPDFIAVGNDENFLGTYQGVIDVRNGVTHLRPWPKLVSQIGKPDFTPTD